MPSDLRGTLIKLKFSSENDDIFLDKIANLAKTNGVSVFQQMFKLLGDIDLPLAQCEDHWNRFIAHRKTISEQLNRPVDITTAVSDFLHITTNLLDNPRLIEICTYENALQATNYDKLTGLFNRRYFDEVYNQQVALTKRYEEDFTVLFLDIDNFKYINDTFGHHIGDQVLKKIADIISAEKRDSDIAARFGGEEFILLLTHSDNLSSYVFAERLRQKIAAMGFSAEGKTLKITVSGGIASFPFDSNVPEDLIEMADSAMYLAKGAGKNRISHFKDEKRRYLRVKVNEKILTKELNFIDTPTLAGVSKDICVGGILFRNDKPFPINSLISVQIQLTEDREPIILVGHVVRVETLEGGDYEIGMTTSFKELDEKVNREISSILENSKNS